MLENAPKIAKISNLTRISPIYPPYIEIQNTCKKLIQNAKALMIEGGAALNSYLLRREAEKKEWIKKKSGPMPISSSFLRHAGKKLIQGWYICPHCGAKTTIACHHCGIDVLSVRIETWSTILYCTLCNTNWDKFPNGFSNVHSSPDSVYCCECNKRMDFHASTMLQIYSGVSPEQRLGELADKKLEDSRREELMVKKRAIAGREQAIKLLGDLMRSPALILDSNIWMNAGFDPFFQALEDALTAACSTVTLYGPQFDEICNVKRKTRFGSGSNRGARCALNRIERLQAATRLRIEQLSIDALGGEDADQLIVKLIIANTTRGTGVAFLSDDMELRIRVRELAASGPGALRIIEGKEFLPMCRDYCIAGGIGFDDIDIDKYYSEMSKNDTELPISPDTTFGGLTRKN